jgi:hypothetical protein
MQRLQRPEDSAYQTNRTATIGFRVEPYVKEAAKRAAAKDRRSLSSLLEKILIGPAFPARAGRMIELSLVARFYPGLLKENLKNHQLQSIREVRSYLPYVALNAAKRSS